MCGSALGPDWSSDLTVRGSHKDKVRETREKKI